MSIDLRHCSEITAAAERLYEAITTPEGIRSWWTTDVAMEDHAGGKAVFGFENHAVSFEMRIVELVAPSLVRWRCDAGTSKEWIGTTQEFGLEPQPGGKVILKFSHRGWKPDSQYAYSCNTTWGHLFVLLKNYAERGEEKPYFA